MALKKNMSFGDWIDFVLRWKWFMIFSFFVIIFIASAYCVVAKEMYKSSTTILVIPQSTPEDYIKATATYRIADRLHTIKQQVLSRTRLLEVIEEFNLYPELQEKAPREILVELMAKSITIELKGEKPGFENVFSLEYFHEDPQTAMLVTSRLANTFMEKNLSIRTEQTKNTARVINRKLNSIKKQLNAKKKELDKYKEKYSGELPEQRTANLGMLTRYQQELQSTAASIRGVEDRILGFYNRLNELKQSPGTSRNKNRQIDELILLGELEEEKMQNLEVKKQIIEENIEIYSQRLENTPSRDLEFNKLEREYNNLLATYEEILGKKYSADMALDLEQIQKGVQFQVIDPAFVPEKPDKPKRSKIILIGVVLSISLALWGSVLLEQFDRSIKTPGEFKEVFEVPMLVSLPEVFAKTDKRGLSPKRAVMAGGVFLYCIVVIAFSYVYLDKIKILLSKLLSRFLFLG
jgi:uncharacterized protein involved in exopolysaccharide biosynthesis